jgi:TPR repeat protein
MYATGKGTSKNLVKAYMWWSLAARAADSEILQMARANQAKAEKLLTADQLKRAKEMMLLCQQSNYQQCE